MDRELVTGGTLYVLATPLGNLADLSERAAEVLRRVDLVAAEDTRRARILLAHVAAKPALVSVHAHAPAARLARVVGALRDGRSVALLTDAGTPGVSDPGASLVRQAHRAALPVVAIPGPSAPAAALSISGLPADRYTFLGFLPRGGAARRSLLDTAARSPWTVVIFEAANRVVKLLEELVAVAGDDRPAALAREITKVHEECRTGTLAELLDHYRQTPPRGEVTLLVGGRAEEPERAADPGPARERARALLAQGLSRKDAAGRLAAEMAMPRNAAYRLVAAL